MLRRAGLAEGSLDGGAGIKLGSGCLDKELIDFFSERAVQKRGADAPHAKKKRLVVFLLALFNVPYAMTWLIHELAESAWVQQEAATSSSADGLLPLDLGALLITPPNANELTLRENDIVVVMAKLDPWNNMEASSRMEIKGKWWKGYMREGYEGWFPNELIC